MATTFGRQASTALAILKDALLGLPATRAGFEGLTAALVAVASGGAVRLMSSGDQQGLDAVGTSLGEGPRRAMQSKRYKKSTSLDLNALLGEMTRADEHFHNIDCWILATTRPVLGKEAEALENHAGALGWKLVTLDWSEQGRGVPPLAALCAAYPEATCATPGLEQLGAQLTQIAAMPGFAQARDEVVRELQAADAGFEAARRAAAARLRLIFENAPAARAIAGASPALLASAPPIARPVLAGLICGWWAASPQVLALLGSEGNGKTWTALQALSGMQDEPGAPLALILSSERAARARDSLHALVGELVAIGDCARLRLRDPEAFWRRRLRLWAAPGGGRPPRIVLLVDGLDEIDGRDWDEWLAPLLVPELSGLVRVILTCRADDWHRRIALRDITADQLKVETVGKFTPEERDAYLTARGVQVSSLAETVLSEALHPRTAFHVTRLAAELPDLKRLTREQLLLRDFANRWEIRRGPLRPEEFRSLVARIARQAQEAALSQASFSKTDAQLAGEAADIAGRDRSEMRRVLSELVSSRWCERPDGGRGEIEFADQALPDAVGLALADDLRGLSAVEVGRQIDRFLEPWGADDLIEAVLRMTATALLTDPTVPDEVCAILLERWFARSFHGDAGQDFWRRLHIVRPALFLDFAEHQDGYRHDWLMEWAIACLWEDHHAGRALVQERVTRWLTYLPLPPEHDGDNPAYVKFQNRSRKRQLQRAEILRRKGATDLRERLIQESGGRDLVTLAARVIGFLPRASFIEAVAGWALVAAAAARDDGQDAMAAVIRDNDEDHEAAVALLRERAHECLSSDALIARRAGAILLDLTALQEDAAPAARWRRAVPKPVWRSSVQLGRDGAMLVRQGPGSSSRPESLVRALAPFAFDPGVHLSNNIASELERAVRSLNADTVPSWLDQDFAMLSVIARWAEEGGRALLRLFLEDVPGTAEAERHARDAFRRVAMAAMPVLDEQELARIADIFFGLVERDGAGEAAAILVALGRAPLRKQLEILLSHPIESWPTERRHLLQRPGTRDALDVVEAIDPEAVAELLLRQLIVSRDLVIRLKEPIAAPVDWDSLMRHPDGRVVMAAIRLGLELDPARAARALAGSGWDRTVLTEPNDCFHSSQLLAHLDDEALVPLLSTLETESWLQLFAERSSLRPSLSPLLLGWIRECLLARRTSWGLGSSYFDYKERQGYFDLLLIEHPEEIGAMLRAAWADKALRSNIRHDHGGGPAWPLLASYMRHDAVFAAEVWNGTVSKSRNMWIGLIEHWPAALPSGPESDALRRTMLARPKTDEKLFHAVVQLQRLGHEALIFAEVDRLLAASRAVDQARAITILGFLEPSDAAEAAWKEVEALPVSDWLAGIRDAARRWREDALALRYWAGQAINEPDNLAAWAAAINMTRVYDGRCSYLYRAEGFKIDPYTWRANWLDLLATARRALRDRRLKELEKSRNLAPRTNNIVYQGG